MAELKGEIAGIVMEVWTDMPGIQLYTGNFLNRQRGKNGAIYRKRSGVALETQYFPNAMSIRHFPSIILKPGALYSSITEYRFR